MSRHPREMRWGCLTVLGLLFLAMVGCSGPSYRFYRAASSGKLKPGISKDEVKALVGDPNGVERRQIAPNELREVWVYHVKNRDLQNHLYPSLRLIVFNNGTMVALDPLDPYSAQLSPPAPSVSEGKTNQ